MSKNIWTWLRLYSPGPQIPTSQASYVANLDLFHAVMPWNGGTLQPNGTWEVGDSPEWLINLYPELKAQGQRYLPVAVTTAEAIIAVLDDLALQEKAARELVSVAQSGRFDTPWDGVYLDLERIPYDYRPKLSQFLQTLSYHLRSADLTVGLSIAGRINDVGAYDFEAVAEIADIVDLRVYDYFSSDVLRPIGPLWWVDQAVDYALGQGIPAQRMTLGLGGFSKYWPLTGQDQSQFITYDQATQLVQDHNSFIQWIESEPDTGLVCERYADVGPGHIWIQDGDTIRRRLDLVDRYHLGGITYWVPGMESEAVWQSLTEWRRPAPKAMARAKYRDLYGDGGLFGENVH